MIEFLQRALNPLAVLMLYVAAECLIFKVFPGYQARATGGFWWLIWLFVGVLAAVSWILLVFA